MVYFIMLHAQLYFLFVFYFPEMVAPYLKCIFVWGSIKLLFLFLFLYDRVPRQEVWRCLREQGVPEKYVRLVKDTYEDARTQVKPSIGLTGHITVRVGLHQGSSLSPYLFDMILDVMGRGIKEQPPWCMLFAYDIVLCSTRRDHVQRKLEEWKTAMEERGLKIRRRKTEYLGCNEHQDAEIQLQEEPL